MVQLVGSEIYV